MTPIGAPISDILHGRVVDYLGVEDGSLVIQFKDGQRARIAWYDGLKKCSGEPVLESLDVSVQVKL